MNVNAQIRINNDPVLKKFIRENPSWYKYLNRDSDNIKLLINDMKNTYKLNISDRISKTMENLSLIESFLNVLK